MVVGNADELVDLPQQAVEARGDGRFEADGAAFAVGADAVRIAQPPLAPRKHPAVDPAQIEQGQRHAGRLARNHQVFKDVAVGADDCAAVEGCEGLVDLQSAQQGGHAARRAAGDQAEADARLAQ